MYGETHIIGTHLAYAPVEDLLFRFVLIEATVTVSVGLGASAGMSRPDPAR
jgi:hypothetical protein